MFTFCGALVCLLLGYIFYGVVVEKIFSPDADAETPSSTLRDNVDFIPIKPWRAFLIQFLNIAGTGPIFGAIMGILFGPAAYLWIVLGCIFAGSVHDYMCGMICMRKKGISLPEIVGDELGGIARLVMRVVSLVLLVLVGAVFVTTPATLLDAMVDDNGFLWSNFFFVALIFMYYILATLLPIDKLISKVYPIFGLALIIMAIGIGYNILFGEGWLPELADEPFVSHHPQGLPIFPMLCVTIACGAISGFHGTQSPLISRCLTNEKYGRPVFYGSMITEGVVALIWAAAAIKFASTLPVPEGMTDATPYEKLAALGNPAIVVKEISVSWMGIIGAVFAVLGVVAAPITSGDTAFRSARLIVADFTHLNQKPFLNRLYISIPLFGIAFACMFIDFNVLWRYFAWTNQTLATFTLWAATVWLARRNKFYWICLIPALFMTAVCTSYIIIAPEGFSLSLKTGLICAVVAVSVTASGYICWLKNVKSKAVK